MGAAAFDALGLGAKPHASAEDSVRGQVKLIDEATRGTVHGNGGYLGYDGGALRY